MKRLSRRNQERLNNVIASLKYHGRREATREVKRLARSQARRHIHRLLGF